MKNTNNARLSNLSTKYVANPISLPTKCNLQQDYRTSYGQAFIHLRPPVLYYVYLILSYSIHTLYPHPLNAPSAVAEIVPLRPHTSQNSTPSKVTAPYDNISFQDIVYMEERWELGCLFGWHAGVRRYAPPGRGVRGGGVGLSREVTLVGYGDELD